VKYLLFTTPHGGYFPSMLNAKVQALNKLRVQLEDFRLQAQKDEAFPIELVGQIKQLEEDLEPQREQAVTEAQVQRSGVYQWHEAFNKDGDIGEVRHLLNLAPEELDNYDIIHVNLCGADADIVPRVKEALGKSSSVNVLCNLDYAIQNWQQGFPMPHLQGFLNSIAQADFVFCVEPAQQAVINHLLHHVIKPSRKKVSAPVIPHPCDVQSIRACYQPPESRLDRIMICYHRYDKHLYIPWMITEDIEAVREKQAIKVPVYVTGIGPDPITLPMFDGAFVGDKWQFYMYELAHSTIAFEYYSLNSHSRFPEECATLGLPCVGNSNSYSIAQLHPLVCHSPLDFTGMRQSLKRLIEDSEFYQQCVDMAWERVQGIDHKASKMRLLFEMDKWAQLEGKQK